MANETSPCHAPVCARGQICQVNQSTTSSLELAIRYGVSINYDNVSQSPWFRYTDEQGRRHEVWFEDARSVQAKFDLVKELGIRGFFYWVLGNEFPQNWLLIEDNFVVRKLM